MHPIAKVLVAISLAGLAVPPAIADSLCPSKTDEQRAEAQLKRAEDAERAGRTREAYAAVEKVVTDCADERRVRALKQRVGRIFGKEAEGAGRLDEAFGWYDRSDSPADADRVMTKLVKSKPNHAGTFDRAQQHFSNRHNEAELAALRALAKKNAEAALAEEEKAFAARRDSLEALNRARDWLRRAGDTQRTAERAERRGDTLAADETRRALETAIQYYDFAEQRAKAKSVQDKARRLADAAAAKGETALAAGYYHIAGDNAKAQAVEKRGEAQQRREEQARQKQFKKDQDKLEKELGL